MKTKFKQLMKELIKIRDEENKILGEMWDILEDLKNEK